MTHRRVPVLALLVALVGACDGVPGPSPTGSPQALRFRVLTEQQNMTPCVDPPDFALAPGEDGWIDAFDRQSACLPEGRDVPLPSVMFEDEVGVAAWWATRECAGHSIETRSVVLLPDGTIEVRARSAAPSPPVKCSPIRTGVLESFLAVTRTEAFDGTQGAVFVLDGREAGRLPGVG